MKKATPKVSKRLVNMMVRFYGSIEAARDAYKTVNAEVKAHNEDKTEVIKHGGKVIWVTTSGMIASAYGSEIFYDRSPDAYFVLPIV